MNAKRVCILSSLQLPTLYLYGYEWACLHVCQSSQRSAGRPVLFRIKIFHLKKRTDIPIQPAMKPDEFRMMSSTSKVRYGHGAMPQMPVSWVSSRNIADKKPTAMGMRKFRFFRIRNNIPAGMSIRKFRKLCQKKKCPGTTPFLSSSEK